MAHYLKKALYWAALLSFAASTAAHCLAEDSITQQYQLVPSSVLPLSLNKDGYAVQYFGDGAYLITDGSGYVSFFLASTEGGILVDAPPTIGRKLQWAIGNITSAPLRYLIYSHSHGDHIGGAYLFANKHGIKTIAHDFTKTELVTAKDPNRPIPDMTFSGDYTLRLGNQTLELSWKGLGPIHDPGNIFIWAPLQKVLMLVDMVFPGWVPFYGMALTQSTRDYLSIHDQILAYPFDHYIGGHQGKSGDRNDVINNRDYIADVLTNCRTAILASATNNTEVGVNQIVPPFLAVNPNNAWGEFMLYYTRVAELCYNLTTPQWEKKLAGQDVFGFSHAFKAVGDLRLEYDILGPFGVM
jgi:glyoxylase-like metal-dependent hydrolase (beta-lactamase superfamily II)